MLLGCVLLAASQSKEIDISGKDGWKDTGIDVQAGDLVKFEATGKLKYADAREENGPDGLSRGWLDLIRSLPLNEFGRGALIGRVGESQASRPFYIGERRESRMPIAGRLFIGTNRDSRSSAEGSFKVKVELMERLEQKIAEYSGPLPKLTKEQWAQIPYRVVDAEGTEGDLVNFIIFGNEEQIKGALLDMGWVIVDKSIKDTILRGAMGTFSKQAYLTMPMSELMVFGRVQDYGFAHSDPVMTVAERHHFRLWKAPFAAEGQEVWVGAGTHDVGFDKDQRNGKVTHKIDSNVDGEREFIGDSLKHSGQVVKLDYAERENKITKANTAHGQEIFSDGRVLLIHLKPAANNLSARFGDYFCSVLAGNPDGGDWGECSKWFEEPGKADMRLPDVAGKYRLLVIPGIMNTCVADTPAFELGRKYLTDKFGVATDILPVPNDSSEDNAKLIAGYIKEKGPADTRPFIVLGYSKGTPDLQEMLARAPETRKYIAAFISVAGASGGSPIADSLPMQVEKYAEYAKRGSCKGNIAQGMKSLKREERQRFLSSYPHPFVPTYSLAAVMDPAEAAKQKLSAAAVLNTYDKYHDGQVLKRDAIIPESAYLGAAKIDHLAIALSFEGTKEGTPQKFPRTALLESLYRFVVDDLEKKPDALKSISGAKTAPAARKDEPSKSWVEGWSQKK